MNDPTNPPLDPTAVRAAALAHLDIAREVIADDLGEVGVTDPTRADLRHAALVALAVLTALADVASTARWSLAIDALSFGAGAPEVAALAGVTPGVLRDRVMDHAQDEDDLEEAVALVGEIPVDPDLAPITETPSAVRPPYGVRDDRLDALRGDTATWRAARVLDRQAVLAEPLVGLPVSEYEARQLEYLAGYDTDTVAVVAALLRRARAAGPLPGGAA